MTSHGQRMMLPYWRFIIVAAETGVTPDGYCGTTIQSDILKSTLPQAPIFTTRPSMRIIADIIARCSGNMPMI